MLSAYLRSAHSHLLVDSEHLMVSPITTIINDQRIVRFNMGLLSKQYRVHCYCGVKVPVAVWMHLRWKYKDALYQTFIVTPNIDHAGY